MDWHALKARIMESRISLVIWLLFSLIGTAAIIRNLLSLHGWFRDIVARAITVKSNPPSMEVKSWLFWLFASLASCLVIAVGLLVRSELNLAKSLTVQDERKTTAFKTMQGMMLAATRIRAQHHPTANKVKKSIRNVEMTFHIRSNFDTDVEQKWDIYASGEPVSFWSPSVRATSEATPMEYLDDINFKVRDDSGNGVVYLPTENDPRAKKVMLYFLPQIEPKQGDRKIVFSYSWPGLFNQLKSKSSETFGWTVESVDPIEKIKFSFFLQKGSGYELLHENIGPVYEKMKPGPISDGDQWSGFVYTLENVPAGKCQVVILLKLKKA